MTHAIVLPAPSADEIAKLGDGKKGQPLRVGVGRVIPADQSRIALSALSWQKNLSGFASTVSIKSTDARSVRVALRLTQDVPGLSVSFRGYPDQLAANTLVDNSPHWSPVVQGDTVVVELRSANIPTASAELLLMSVSHIP